MKKILLSLLLLSILSSCSNEHYDALNHDDVKPEKVPSDYLVTSAITSYIARLHSTNVNNNIFRLVAQYWNETTYTQESNYDLETRAINDRFWNELNTRVLYDLEDAKRTIPDEIGTTDLNKKNQIAIVELLQVQAWQSLVDTFGDIPYTEALMGTELAAPKYDDAKTIYNDLIKRALAATNDLDVTAQGFLSEDIIYHGDIAKWKKFGASLQLKLGLNLADVDPDLAHTTINNAIATGVFSSQADNFTLNYPGAIPNTNPLWVDLVQSGRTDFVAANTIVDYMNTLNDPRRAKYFRQNLGDGIFLGGEYGSATSYANHTQISSTLHQANYPGTLLDYTEVLFMLAEASERGINTSESAESLYESAIRASFEFWGNTPVEADEYLAQTSVNYQTAEGTWKQKIGLQYYLALYNKGLDAWTVYRRLDAPQLNIAAATGLPIPNRYTYPVRERNLNKANNAQAATAIGGDTQATKLFWDKN
ncbi:SusD/RagB family nutrient-binding outer membrane lipoprotein [Flavobacterium sp. HSC-61S13]|uniref:SusD/RagB family nutrient-binding outer membrane lipoprotein n=1 Tax=Flavobacterium sp. HSC-61S13 TaxID=2910963 RepID=UPI0020A17513|nr:SusD/RagB family nutrient-binding outer membrane lipoprotein [Flavobacterium sp. HSC-61S13]MCP1994813.1 hypothetical protein [Flavobacterium sp. HSC-61S13]